MTTSSTLATPKCAGTACRSLVSGPRPSSARTAHHSASGPRSPPPPQSPLIRPSARNLVVRPSGATPTQLMPAPQVTPMPQCSRAPAAAGEVTSSRPARRTANVSFTTVLVVDQPCAAMSAPSSASSSGRSAPARHADVCRATGPGPVRPACAATARTSSVSTATVLSRPMP